MPLLTSVAEHSSCRIPAAFCGIVGFKPTFGLVPYTGILGLQSTIDHAGPITRTVRENALLLEAIAGPDGLDDRQPPLMPPTDFSNALDQFLVEHPEMPLRGFKIGVLKEGFTSEHLDPNIAEACRAAISVLKDLGAEIVDMSVPTHQQTFVAWMCALPLRGAREGLLGDTTGRKQLELTERGPSLAPAMGTAPTFLSQEVFDSFAAGAQNLYMRHLYVQQKHGAMLHAKSMNILRQAARDYDDVLSSVDVLVMPTVPMPARPFPKTKGGPLQGLSDAAGMLDNTAQFNATGHPALSIPVGFVPAKDDAGVKLPVGLQIVAKRWDDLTCYKVGSAWEMKMDWKTLEFGVQPQT